MVVLLVGVCMVLFKSCEPKKPVITPTVSSYNTPTASPTLEPTREPTQVPPTSTPEPTLEPTPSFFFHQRLIASPSTSSKFSCVTSFGPFLHSCSESVLLFSLIGQMRAMQTSSHHTCDVCSSWLWSDAYWGYSSMFLNFSFTACFLAETHGASLKSVVYI